jgi:hypothetical protein
MLDAQLLAQVDEVRYRSACGDERTSGFVGAGSFVAGGIGRSGGDAASAIEVRPDHLACIEATDAEAVGDLRDDPQSAAAVFVGNGGGPRNTVAAVLHLEVQRYVGSGSWTRITPPSAVCTTTFVTSSLAASRTSSAMGSSGSQNRALSA